MEFYIHSDRYYVRNEENGAYKLMVTENNQVIDIESIYGIILNKTDCWVNLDHMSRVIAMTSFRKDVVSGLWNRIFELHAAGVADLKNVPSFGKDGCRWGNVFDYYALSDFLKANMNKGQSCTVVTNPAYYSYYSVRFRIDQKIDTVALYEKEGKIKAAAVFGPSDRTFGGPVLELKSLIFDENYNEDECKEIIRQLTDFASTQLKGKLFKLRYEYISPRQEFVVNALKGMGFEESACFKDEVDEGKDLVLIDRMI